MSSRYPQGYDDKLYNPWAAADSRQTVVQTGSASTAQPAQAASYHAQPTAWSAPMVQPAQATGYYTQPTAWNIPTAQPAQVASYYSQPTSASTHMAVEGSWFFGVELELTIRPPQEMITRWFGPNVTASQLSWDTVAGMIHTGLSSVLFGRREVVVGPSPTFSAWSITKDHSIRAQTQHGFCGFEIISPVLNVHQHWEQEIEVIMETLSATFELRFSSSCGTHIHVSPGSVTDSVPWDLRRLASLAKCIVYYDPLIDALVPDSRHGSGWCLSNIFADRIHADLSTLAQDGYKKSFETIDIFAQQHRLRDLVLYMSPSKFYAWNFSNLERRCGTIEFRRPPMSNDARDVQQWTKFVLAFVSAATAWPRLGYMEQRKSPPPLSELQDFMNNGDDVVSKMFRGKSYHPSMTRPFNYATISSNDRELMQRKQEKKSILNEKMTQAQLEGN